MLEEEEITKFDILWYGIIFWAVAFTAIEAAFSFSFQTTIHNWQLWADALVSLIFATDLYFDLKSLNKERKNPKFRMTNVIYFHLAVNIVASIPFDVLTWAFDLEHGLQVLPFIRLFRLVRIVKIYSIVHNMTIVPKIIRVQILIVSTMIFVHWIACIWVIIHPPGEQNHTEYYVKSLYWAVTTLTTVGYGDISPTTMVGRIYTMIIMIAGVGFYGVVIGGVTNAIGQANKYREETEEKFADLSLFMRHYKVPKKIQQACFKYYQHIFQQRIGQNDQKIIADLPLALQQELKNYMNMKLISELSIFDGCSSACLKTIANELEQTFYSPGQYMIKVGDIGEEMFIIHHGDAEVTLEDGTVVATLGEGQFFGEVALLEETTRTANVRAKNYCDVYKLNKSDFLDVIKKFPELFKNMQIEIESRKKS